MRLLIALLVLSANVLVAQTDSVQTSSRTIDMVESAVRDLVDSVVTRAGVTAGSSLEVFVHDHPDAPWVRSIISRRMEERGVPVALGTAARTDLDVVIMDVSTRYQLTQNPDSVEREVVVKLETTYRQRRLPLEPKSVRTTLGRSEALASQSAQHTGTHAALPDAPSSLWNDVLEPLIYVGAAVVTVLLFYTVRTQ
ncbi:MAG: hypothetical protein ACKOE4_04720 [Candidatus Kapaibacterium sp.]